MNKPTPVLENSSVYLGDNGRAFCGACAGMNARYTGHDVSGQKVMRVTKDDAEQAFRDYGAVLRCEECGHKA